MDYKHYLSLVDKANAASTAYYVKAKPTMTDTAFDGLLLQIEEAERTHPEWTAPDSPTLRVGSDLCRNGRRRVRHRTPMKSCQKANTLEDLTAWMEHTAAKMGGAERMVVSVECKLDGISCAIVYQDGALVSAATRGDGKTGQDITPHALMMANVPRRLDGGPLAEGRLEVRGEIVCPTEMLHLLSRNYADCRTAAASICNAAVATDDCRRLTFLPWQADGDAEELKRSHTDALRFLTEHTPFRAPYFRNRFSVTDREGIRTVIAHFSDRKTRERYAWPLDGLLVKVDDRMAAASLGETEKFGRWNIAYKFDPPTVLTRCTDIRISVAKSGKRTPVAYFEPVELLGRRLTKASLYSEKTALELGIEVGSLIEVGLQNDVTVKVLRVVKPETETLPNDRLPLLPVYADRTSATVPAPAPDPAERLNAEDAPREGAEDGTPTESCAIDAAEETETRDVAQTESNSRTADSDVQEVEVETETAPFTGIFTEPCPEDADGHADAESAEETQEEAEEDPTPPTPPIPQEQPRRGRLVSRMAVYLVRHAFLLVAALVFIPMVIGVAAVLPSLLSGLRE